jgi:hypothetical protein
VNEFYPSHSGFLKARNVQVDKPGKMVIFGYKDEQFPVLLSAIKQRFIAHSWFNGVDEEGIYVFFVSEGASLLKEREWSSVFSKWVAFEKFDFLIGLPIGDQESTVLFPQLLDAIQRSNSPEEINKEFIRIFDESIQRLGEKDADNEADKELTVYKLIVNKNNLEYRQKKTAV